MSHDKGAPMTGGSMTKAELVEEVSRVSDLIGPPTHTALHVVAGTPGRGRLSSKAQSAKSTWPRGKRGSGAKSSSP